MKEKLAFILCFKAVNGFCPPGFYDYFSVSMWNINEGKSPFNNIVEGTMPKKPTGAPVTSESVNSKMVEQFLGKLSFVKETRVRNKERHIRTAIFEN